MKQFFQSHYRSRRSSRGSATALPAHHMLWLLLAIAMAIVPHWRNLPGWFWPVAALIFLWRGYSLGKPLHRWQVLLVTTAVLAAITVSAQSGLGRSLGITILASMAMLKTLETRTRRDAWVLIALGFFLLMTRFLYGQDLILLPWLLLTTLMLAYALLLTQGNATGSAWFIPRLFKQTARYLMLALPVGLIFFLIFPRLSSPIWGSPELFGQGKTGLGNSMRPGSIAELFLDDSPAMRVNFHQPPPASDLLYWRGPVLEEFDGTTWRAHDYILPRTASSPAQDHKTITYDIELEPHGHNFLPMLDVPVQAPKGAFLMPDWHVQQDHPVTRLKHYRGQSQLANPHSDHLTPSMRRRLLSLPHGLNPRTRGMMQRWRGQTPDTRILINRILQWFHQENFIYTFTPPPLQGDSVDQFLFETRAGFCEHYASAFTVMMRFAGVPARVVTGYQGGLNNRDYWLVRQSDAHAWSEVWLAGHGWLRVDPTTAVAPSRVASGAQSWLAAGRNWYDYGWVRGLRLSLDTWRYRWNRWIRNYNTQAQKNLLRSLGLDSANPATFAWLIAVTLLAGGVGVLLFLAWTRTSPKQHPAEKIFTALQKQLTRHGLPRTRHEGPSTYLLRAARRWPGLTGQIQAFRRLYEKHRYAPELRHLSEENATWKHLQSKARALQLAIKKEPPTPADGPE